MQHARLMHQWFGAGVSALLPNFGTNNNSLSHVLLDG
jgi:hypothetical protein